MKLASMTASVAGRYASTKVKGLFQSDESAEQTKQEANRDSGNRIAKTLGELKGAVMKVGQMASIASDLLPKELSDALGKLQKEAPPMDYSVIAEQIEKELGSPPEMLFESFDKEPFASASIGQVHRARTDDGREVVCKVQYPGVDGAVDSDLRHLKLALRASGIIKVDKKALDATFAEVRMRLHEELDYCNEADNVRLFQEFHTSRHPFLVIPNVVGERSSQRVLTLEYQHGDSIQDVEKGAETGVGPYDKELRDKLGRHLFLLMASEILELGAIHGDPNPGNFAFRPDGTIVVYDFGCVKKLPRDTVQAWKDGIVFGLQRDYQAVDEALIRLGVRAPKGPPVEPEYYARWRDVFAEPYEVDAYDFGNSHIHEKVMKLVPSAMKRLSSFQPAKEIIFLDRMVGGHYGNLRTIGATVPLRELLDPYLDAFAPEKLLAGV